MDGIVRICPLGKIDIGKRFGILGEHEVRCLQRAREEDHYGAQFFPVDLDF